MAGGFVGGVVPLGAADAGAVDGVGLFASAGVELTVASPTAAELSAGTGSRRSVVVVVAPRVGSPLQLTPSFGRYTARNESVFDVPSTRVIRRIV